MTDREEICSMNVVEFCREFNRRMAAKQAEFGARIDDIALAAIYSAVDLAQHHAGNPAAAIAWARRALDVMEDGLPLTMETVQ